MYMRSECFYLHHNWKFSCAHAAPLPEAVRKTADAGGHAFYEPEYDDSSWKTVTLPHTFNDADLFRNRIRDAGSGQERTVSLYRNCFQIPEEHRGQKAILEFEGVRQAAYVYVNGHLTGYYEAGVGPFGIDITPELDASKENCIAVAVDSTSSRNCAFCIAETPAPDVPGTYVSIQDTLPGGVKAQENGILPEGYHKGVPFQWNCNDFNPTIGGLAHPVKLYFKPPIYLTLPLYANLKTRGTYLYGSSYDLKNKTVCVNAEAEVKNESGRPADLKIRVSVRSMDGRLCGEFESDTVQVQPQKAKYFKTITPADAWHFDQKEGQYVPNDTERFPDTSSDGTVIKAESAPLSLSFWSISHPVLYRVQVELLEGGKVLDADEYQTGFRDVAYDADKGVLINGEAVWLRGYAQRASNEWAASGIVPQWLHDYDAELLRASNANHVRYMHVAAFPEDIRADDRYGVTVIQPAGDKEQETFGRQWEQRLELMRNVLIAYRNHPSILFWEAGNNSISREHMHQMRMLKQELDPNGGRFMGCRTLNEDDVVNESEYVGTMLNRHAARFISEHGPICESEYAREEAPARVWDDFTPPDYDYRNKFVGQGGKKQNGRDFYDLTSEDLALADARGYSEFFNDRMGGASGRNLYSACAALCWTDSAQHGRQAYSENARMSGRVNPMRVKKQNFEVFRVMQSPGPAVKIIGHWNYPDDTPETYRYPLKRYNGDFFEETGEWGRRNPHDKTVYVIGSYDIARVELYINGKCEGECSQPADTFVFRFPGIDITQHGEIRAVGYGYDGRPAADDRIMTAGKAQALVMKSHVSPEGFQADGADLAMVDVAVVDEKGQICPLADNQIRFSLSGPGEFLGGYTSGRFDGYEEEYKVPRESVIHKSYVYAECGENRVIIRSKTEPGQIVLRAEADGLQPASVVLHSQKADLSTLTPVSEAFEYKVGHIPQLREDFPAIAEADRCKYIPPKEDYCKIMVNGQEPDSRGVTAVSKNGRVWGNVCVILDRMQIERPGCLTYTWNAQTQELVVNAGGHVVTAKTHRTNLLVDGDENLMDGEPYLTEKGVLVMEVGALVSQVPGASVLYDDRIHALRITI